MIATGSEITGFPGIDVNLLSFSLYNYFID
jgi:hypothetical protein